MLEDYGYLWKMTSSLINTRAVIDMKVAIIFARRVIQRTSSSILVILIEFRTGKNSWMTASYFGTRRHLHD